MANAVVLYWRDIPAQVTVRAGRTSARRELPKRFIEAIDRAAMKAGFAATDQYLEAWRRGEPTLCGPDLDAEADRIAQILEREYPDERLRHLSANGGLAEAG